MKVKDWDSIYNHEVRWCLRQMSSEPKRKEDYVKCLEMLNNFEDDLFDNYLPEGDPLVEFKMTYDNWFSLCHAYIDKARIMNNTRKL